MSRKWRFDDNGQFEAVDQAPVRKHLDEPSFCSVTQQVLEVANSAYKDGAGMISTKMLPGERNDLLADAIRHEIIWAIPRGGSIDLGFGARLVLERLEGAATELSSVVKAVAAMDFRAEADEILEAANASYENGECNLDNPLKASVYIFPLEEWIVHTIESDARRMRGTWQDVNGKLTYVPTHNPIPDQLRCGLEAFKWVCAAVLTMADNYSDREKMRAA